MRVLIWILFFWVTFTYADDPYKNLLHYTLPNGLKVYLLPDDKAKNISIEAEVKVGMKAETKETAGLSHLVEHIVFRDQRVPGKDYYNIIKDKGATNVNGYTSYYKTRYVTTISPKNAYWITKSFYTMLFDKNITEEDLKVEKGALQLEIGEPNWLDYLLPDFRQLFQKLTFLRKILPPNDDVYEHDFSIDPLKEVPHYQSTLDYRLNNKKFTLKQVMEHYHTYYFPANITLKIVGKYDLQKMKKLIDETFAKVPKRSGKSVEEPIFKDAKLNNKPYIRYSGGENDSASVTIGAKLLRDDPKKVIALEAYTDSLADRLLKKFRNKEGKAYGVSGYLDSYRNAAIAQVSFSAPHKDFDEHIKIAKAWIEKEARGDINDSVIQDALKQKRSYYDAVEHDTLSLMDSVDSYIWQQREFPGSKTPYQLLESISPQYFKKVLHDTFTPDHAYMMLHRDYRFFPYEASILMFILFVISIIFFIRFITARVPKRKVLMKRSMTNWFTIFLIAILIGMVTEFVDEWVAYLISKIYPIYPNYYDIPKSYLLFVLETVIDIAVTYLVVKTLFRWFYLRLFITTDQQLILSGVKPRYIDLNRIKSLEVVPYFPRPRGKVYGNALLFWRKLLKLTLDDGEEIYLRSANAQHLKEDIEQFLVKPHVSSYESSL